MIVEAVSETLGVYKLILEENNKVIIAGLDSKPLTTEVASLYNKHDTLHATVSTQGRDSWGRSWRSSSRSS